MAIILIALALWAVCKAAGYISAQAREQTRLAQLERIRRDQERQRAEQARLREEWKAAQTAERERVRQMVELEREQAQQAKEQERLAKEQEKQAAQLAKHEKRIADLEYRMTQAEADILAEQDRLDYYTRKLSALDDQIEKLNDDIEYYQLAEMVDRENKARVEQDKLRDSVFRFEEKVRASEKRMAKAQYIRDNAKREIAAA